MVDLKVGDYTLVVKRYYSFDEDGKGIRKITHIISDTLYQAELISYKRIRGNNPNKMIWTYSKEELKKISEDEALAYLI